MAYIQQVNIIYLRQDLLDLIQMRVNSMIVKYVMKTPLIYQKKVW